MASVLILLDHSENYTFHFQVEVQRYHRSYSFCSVHTAMCYNKDQSDQLKKINFCFVSDDLQHDVALVYAIPSKF